MNADAPGAPDRMGQSADARPEVSLVVGIGASAGGLEALQKLLAGLRAEGMAFVIVQHLAPGHETALSEILARATSLPVVIIENGQTLERDHIYVAPPDMDVRLEGNQLRLEEARRSGVPRRSVDVFLCSLARGRGPAAIGVVLSGTGADGMVGLRSIQEEGGITFAQDPATALQAGMPQAAIDAGAADFCLDPEEIAAELMRFGAHAHPAPRGPLGPEDEATLQPILDLLRGDFDIGFEAHEHGTVERRIRRRMALHAIDSLAGYLALLQRDPTEAGLLRGDLLAGVSIFFRDRSLFDSLASLALPRLLESRGDDTPIRVWVAGCGSGEETYSLAIVLLEQLADRAPAHKIQIFATDLDEQALTRARRALYPLSLERELSLERLQRFFSREDQGYRVRRHVRDLVVFGRHDVGKQPPFSRLDLISYRDVLPRRPLAEHRRILGVLHHALTAGGILVLGHSQSVRDAGDLFECIDRDGKIFVKRGVIAAAHEAAAPRQQAQAIGHHPPPGASASLSAITHFADRQVLGRYAPPGVLVNQAFDVLQFWGRTGRFLEPFPGAASLNLLKLVRPDLGAALRATMEEAVRTRAPVTSAPTPTQQGPQSLVVSLEVMPLAEEAAQPCYIVLFHERPPPAPAAGPPSRDEHGRAAILERELEVTRESLLSTIEELQTSNEELQTSNEELQSSNEELQVTNQELETSKAELESTNRELTTLNDELHSRMDQLGVVADDLRNVFDAGSAAMLLIGPDLRIRAFSGAAGALLNLLPGDRGRPVTYIRNKIVVGDLEEVVGEVIGGPAAAERRVRSTDGASYTMRIVPYKTSDGAIRGALIELSQVAPAPMMEARGEHGRA